MQTEIVWVIRGPQAGVHLAMPPGEAADAERDGWAQRCANKDGSSMRPAIRDDHPAATAFLAGRKSRPAKSRDMEAERPAPALNRQMETDSRPGSYKTKATGKKRSSKKPNREG